MIRRGFDAELDELHDITKTRPPDHRVDGGTRAQAHRDRVAQDSLQPGFWLSTLRFRKPILHLVPADYERKQTLVNAERFTSSELKEHEQKVLSAEERVLEIERRLYSEIRESIARRSGAAAAHGRGDRTTRRAGEFCAHRRDAKLHAAGIHGYRRLLKNGASAASLMIAGGRHPVIEKLLEERGERFVPNDLYLDDESQFLLLITGPNMGGKSTYLRQAALISILAQMGSFVPATQAKLPLLDRIFTRIGASDNLARGRSTFLVEMSEVAAILNTATAASLVLLDEVGRGTATFDGLSIAWAVVEALHAGARPRTLFATHYHELTELEQLLPGVKNVHVSVHEAGSEIVFLRRVEPGSANKSYGIEVARLGGIAERRDRARAGNSAAARTERGEADAASLSPGAVAVARPAPAHQTSFTAIDESVLDAIRGADLNKLTPIEAMNLLAALQKQLS